MSQNSRHFFIITIGIYKPSNAAFCRVLLRTCPKFKSVCIDHAIVMQTERQG